MTRPPTAAEHSAGATVRHDSPFSHLEVPGPPVPLSEALKDWTVALYMKRPGGDGASEFRTAVLARAKSFEPAVAFELLSQRDWGPRTVGAYLAAIWQLTDLDAALRNLLLRSDVCYAGAAYCRALVSLGTAASVPALREYLGYYLDHPELWFDQADALGALTMLDERNGTRHAEDFSAAWTRFVANKPNWNIHRTRARVAEDVRGLEALSTELLRTRIG